MIKDQIYTDLKEAMKNKEALKLNTLRMVKAEIMKFEVSGANKVAGDKEILSLLKRSVKQRKEAADSFIKGGNQESAKKELAEIKILEQYLPAQLSDQEVEILIKEVISDLSAQKSDFGKVMGEAVKKAAGRADGSRISMAVKKLLG